MENEHHRLRAVVTDARALGWVEVGGVRLLGVELLAGPPQGPFEPLVLGLTDEAQTAGAILGYNYQSSPFYQDAFNQLKAAGLAPEAAGTNWLSSVYRQMIKGEWM